MRTCTKCNEFKDLSGFGKRKSGASLPECKKCACARTQKWHAANPGENVRQSLASAARKRVILDGAKDVPCHDCGQRYPSYVMDFDHRDPDDKLFNLAQALTRSPKSVRAEMAKCDVVCSNCHRIRTHGDSQRVTAAKRLTADPVPAYNDSRADVPPS